MRRYAFEAIAVHLLWILFLFGFTDGFAQPFFNWLENFYQWDARWYGTIAMDGHGFLPQTYAFPPLHGWLLGRITDVGFHAAHFFDFKITWIRVFYIVAFVMGVAAFAGANAILVRLAERRWSIDRRRLWAIAVTNPMAYFAFTAYSDAFFFAVMMIIILLALLTSDHASAWKLSALDGEKKSRAKLALTVFLFVAPWIRLTGFAFAVWAFLRRREVLATFLSLGAYLIYERSLTGDPFFFLFAQKVFNMPEGNGFTGAIRALKIFASFFNGDAYRGGDFFLYCFDFGLLPVVCFTLSLSLIIWLAKKREWLPASAVASIVFISHNQAFWRSTVRYTLPVFPMFYWMLLAEPKVAQSGTAKRTRQIIATVALALSLAIQVFYCRLFRSGGWAF